MYMHNIKKDFQFWILIGQYSYFMGCSESKWMNWNPLQSVLSQGRKRIDGKYIKQLDSHCKKPYWSITKMPWNTLKHKRL